MLSRTRWERDFGRSFGKKKSPGTSGADLEAGMTVEMTEAYELDSSNKESEELLESESDILRAYNKRVGSWNCEEFLLPSPPSSRRLSRSLSLQNLSFTLLRSSGRRNRINSVPLLQFTVSLHSSQLPSFFVLKVGVQKFSLLLQISKFRISE